MTSSAVSSVPVPKRKGIAPFIFQRARKMRGVQKLVHRFWPSSVVEVEDGLRLRVYPGRNSSDMVAWLYGEIPAPPMRREFVARIGDADALVVDIGANSGLFTVYFASRTSSGSTIVAIEPNQGLHAQIRENLALNNVPASRVEIIGKALYSEKGRMLLNVTPANLGASTLLTDAGFSHSISVETDTLLDVVAERSNGRLIEIKIDVEGAEPDVMEPYLRHAPDHLLADLILMETCHSDLWSPSFMPLLVERGYSPVLEGPADTLFQRSSRVGNGGRLN